MAESSSIPLPPGPVPFEPQDLDDLIFRWDIDVPPVSDR